MNRFLALTLTCALLLLFNGKLAMGQQSSTQPNQQLAVKLDDHSEKMKRNITKLGVGHQVTAVLKDGMEYHGAITEIGEETFKVAEVDLKQVFTVRYDNVNKLYRDYSNKNPLFGRNPKKNTIIFVSVMGFLTAVLVAAIAHPE